ncbi:ead/Ea22-like family protein [Leclercia adecarboxylata]|uniref:ead/Ea22-like family protein n=1 Tax=Leclercia adecarboxylata TaxID=83655 RepID=UPI003018F4D5
MTNKQALREAAIYADGEKWRYVRTSVHSKAYITNEMGLTVVNCTDGDVPAKCAGFIELANPSAVLALLDELDNREKLRAAANRVVNQQDIELQELRQRVAKLEAREVKLPELKMLSDYLREVTMREREDILLGVKLEFHRELQAAGIITRIEG